MTHLFCTLDSQRIADLVRSAERFVCYAGPGVQELPAQAMAEVATRLGPEVVAIALDFDSTVLRMGFGEVAAVKALREAGILVRSAPGLRTALVIVDDMGYQFAPTALYLEAEPHGDQAINAMRLSTEQVHEALSRLSPAAKAMAVAQIQDESERERISQLPVEVGTQVITEEQFAGVANDLADAPPVKFDLARQVRVFNAYLQYVEMKLTGAAIQRHRLAIPASILRLGTNTDLEGRLRTTFELIESESDLSSRGLESELNGIRKSFTRSLGRDHGRVVLKAAKPHLQRRLDELQKKLTKHQESVQEKLQEKLIASRKQIVDYYVARVVDDPPDKLLGQLPHGKATEDDARQWLDNELGRVFPKAEALIQDMRLDVRFKDVTFETLNHPEFLESVKREFPRVDWDKAYTEFRAAGESD